jgi:outer membrane autotransporter protein
MPTASRAGDVQIGAGFTYVGKPGYVQESFRGVAAYADFDVTTHLGIEAEFHQANTSSNDQIYERTYEVGGRYHLTYGPLLPYAKVLIGRGVFNYQYDRANLAYNLVAEGVGVDVKIGQYVRVRGEYEYQRWANFQNGEIAPQLVTIGVAYHFAGKPRYR